MLRSRLGFAFGLVASALRLASGLVSVWVVGVVLASGAAWAGKPEHAGKGGGDARGWHDERGDRDRRHDRDRYDVHFDAHIRAVYRDWYGDHYGRGHCPPGLAKKRNGCLPPGLAKKRYRIGYPLPEGIAIGPIPVDLSRRLGPPPHGYRYGIVDGDLVKLAVGTLLVVDAVNGLLD